MKKLLFSIILLLSLGSNIFADVPQIFIQPDNEEYTRLSSGLSGSNISIIDSEELKTNLNKNLPQILEFYSGIEVRRLYDGINGSNSSIDMRGFGEASKSNALILINGIRLNDIDMSNINFSHIPIESIERIEIIRGGSAATLYGSGAVGGAINVVTKTKTIEDKLNYSFGSYQKQKVNFSVSSKINHSNSITFSGSGLETDTFRNASEYSDHNFVLNLKNFTDKTKINVDIFSANKDQDLPGPRVKGGAVFNYHFCNRYEDSKTAKHIGGSFSTNGDSCNVNQRDDYSNSENTRIKASLLYEFDLLNKMFIGTGYKEKSDKAFLASNSNTIDTPSNGDRYLDTTIDGNHFNVRFENKIIEVKQSNILSFGIDHSHSFYESKRYRNENESLGHIYDADLKTQAIYFQNTLYFTNSDFTMSFGARSEKTYFAAEDEVNRTVPGFINSWDATDHLTIDTSSTNQALNIGFEKRVNNNLSLYGNYSESYRIPNIDERIQSTTSGSFSLKDQESEGIEIGLIYSNNLINLNTSFYEMDTLNEIQYNQSVNTNLDPIERQGINLDFEYKIDSKQKLVSSFNYTIAEFTAGTLTPGTGGDDTCNFDNTTYCSNSDTWKNLIGGGTLLSLAGKSVPLVAPKTFSIYYQNKIQSKLDFNLELKYTDEKFVSNDQENIEPKIPDYYLINSSISSINGPYTFTFGMNNVFNEKIFDFAVSSTFHDDAHYGLSNVYPLPERNIFIDFGYTF